MNIVNVLKMLSDKNRLRIINLINESPMCVTEIQVITGLQQSNTSRHLEKLKSNNLVTSYKDTNKIYYSLNKDFFSEYHFLKELILFDIKKESIFINDLKRLKYYQDSGYSCEEIKDEDFDIDKLTN